MPLIRPINPISNIPRPIGGTDLGVPFRAFGGIGLVFGDTFGKQNNGALIPAVGGQDWRSPVICWSNRIGNVLTPLSITGAVRGGDQLWAYPHDNPTFSTVLPCDCIEINGRMYVWVMVTKGLGNERWCELAYSDDRGNTWRNNGQWGTGRFRGMRTMLTFDWVPGSPVIDIFSTGGLARNKGLLRWRCAVKDFLNPAGWVGWCFLDGRWQWRVNPADWEPSEILPGWKLGEISLRFMQGHCLLSGFDAGDYSIFVKVANDTDANWVTAPTYRVVTGVPRGVDWLPQLYGGYIHPDSTFGGGITIIVSNWNTATNNPYQSSQYVIWGILPTRRGTGDASLDNLQETEATRAMLAHDLHKPKRQYKARAQAPKEHVRVKMLLEPEMAEDVEAVISYQIQKLEVARSLPWSRLYAQLLSLPSHSAARAWLLQIAEDASPSSMDDEDIDQSDKIPAHLRWVTIGEADQQRWTENTQGREKVLLRLAPKEVVQQRLEKAAAKAKEEEEAYEAKFINGEFIPRRPVVDSSIFESSTEADSSSSSSSSSFSASAVDSEDDEWDLLVEEEHSRELVWKKPAPVSVKLAGASQEARQVILRGHGEQGAAESEATVPASAAAPTSSSSPSSPADVAALTSRLAALEAMLAMKK